MSMTHCRYHATFSEGDLVVIADVDVLNKYHCRHGRAYGVTDGQLAFANEEAEVINIGIYHAGVILYQLGGNRSHLEPPEPFPGVWFEECVSDYTVRQYESEGLEYVPANSWYRIEADQRGEHWYVVVRDVNGVECFAALGCSKLCAESDAVGMRKIASRRDVTGFAAKYGFTGTWNP